MLLSGVADPTASLGIRWAGGGALPTPIHALPVAATAKGARAAKAVLAKAKHHAASHAKAAVSAAAVTPPPPPFSPLQLRHFYGVDSLLFGNTVGNGMGQTIAIIDADGQPNIKSDLTTFDNQFGLNAPPSFVVESQTGSTTNLPTAYDSIAALETSLDVEWAHALAPAANLLLIECNSLSFGDTLGGGVALANATPGVSVVSMSFGTPDNTLYGGFGSSNAAYYDQYFQQPGVTYLASAADGGAASTSYPATSPYVVAVGGTSITTPDTAGTYGSETAWNDASPNGATGGGISGSEPPPPYQSVVGLAGGSTVARTAPDVSLDGDPLTGVYVYDSSQANGGGYYQVGGTSLSAPCWAGLIADADQGRALAGLPSLTGSTQTLPRLYQLPSTDFHDVTTGTNNYAGTGGYPAGGGYDLASGLGTPIANRLLPDLAGGATVTGRLYSDNNANGVFDGTDAGLAGQTVYLDLNNNGVLDTTASGIGSEPSAVTTATGTYTFSSLAYGGDLIGGLSGTVRLLNGTPVGYVPVGTSTAFATAYATTATANVNLFPTAFADANAGDAYTVRVSPTSSTTEQVLVNGTVAYSAPTSLVATPGLSFTFTGTGDTLTVDSASGNPVPTGGLSVNGTAAADADALTVLGTTGTDTVVVNAATLVFNGRTITFSNVPTLSVDPRTGTDSLTVNAGTVNVPARPAGGGYLARTFSTLAVAAGADLALGSAAARTDRTVVVLTAAAGLSVAATAQLNLGGNDLIVRGGAASGLTTVSKLVAAGFAGGTWAGTGIASSAAAADPAHVSALATVLGSTAAVTTVDGTSLGSTDVLVRYTYYGDANADGVVNAADYVRTDTGFVTRLTGWANGDFNYDGSVDGSDYSLIDNAFNRESGLI